jgi:hypothetical protein
MLDLERKLNTALQSLDGVHIYGSLHMPENCCANINVPQLCANIIIVAAATNVGIDNLSVNLARNLGWMRNLFIYFQQRRRGRQGRQLAYLVDTSKLGASSPTLGCSTKIT